MIMNNTTITWGDKLKLGTFKTFEEAIESSDEIIDSWHNNSITNLHLIEYLGLTTQEYQDFLISPKKLITPYLSK